MKTEILKKLREAGGYVSGQELCDTFGVSRTAVWKAINQLKDAGYVIDSVPRRGYLLKENPDVLSRAEIESRLQTKWLGHPVCYYDETDSTNLVLKRLAQSGETDGNGALAVAEKQTAGRGRRGRSWETPVGCNIAMSLLLRPTFPPEKASMLTLVAALAVAEGLSECSGLNCRIKWPNDVVVNGKKVCGILTEMSAEIDYIQYVIVGIGINVNNEGFEGEYAQTATSLYLESGKKILRAEAINAILCAFEKYLALFEKTLDLSLLRDGYQDRLAGIGSGVRVLDPKGAYNGISHGINETGELLVETESGEIIPVYAGEVSVRGIYGYV